MTVFFVSDLHFGHANIIGFNRDNKIAPKFDTLEEREEYIIARWNDKVHKRDKVFILGDACFHERDITQLGRLNGIKDLILGNHDNLLWYDAYKKAGINKISAYCRYKGSFILSHVPIHPSEMVHRWMYNIHGHNHFKQLDDKRFYNVCIDVVGYEPMAFDEMQTKIALRALGY